MSNSDNPTHGTGDRALSPPTGSGEAPAVIPAPVSPAPHVLTPRGAAAPPSPPSAPNATALLKALRRRSLLAVTLGTLLAAATAAGVWLFLPPGKHVAYVKLFMPMHPEAVLFQHPEAGADFANFQRTQIALLKSRLVLNAALRNPKVEQLHLDAVTKSISAVEWLEKEVRVEYPDGPELPRVTMSGDEPEQPKVLVTAVVDAYLEEVVTKQTVHRQTRLDQLNAIATKYEDRLKRLQNAKNELARLIGAGDNLVIAQKQKFRENQLGLAQADLIKVDTDLMRMELEAKVYQAREGAAIEIPDKLVEAHVDKDLEKDLALRKEMEDRLKKNQDSGADESTPLIRNLREALDKKDDDLKKKRQELRASHKTKLLEMAQFDAKAQLVLLNERVGFHREFKKLLEKEVERLLGEAKDLNNRAIDLDGGRMDLQQAEAGVARVKAEIDKVAVELPAAPRVSKLEDVIVVPPDEASRKLKTAGLAALGAFAAVLLLVSFLEFHARRLDSADEVVQTLGLELMGTLPAAPRRFGGRLLRSTASNVASWQSMLAESVDSARTLLLRGAGSGAMRVVMVTSAISGEGKTSLATHLAASLARAGHRTLLLDGDLRRPAAHRIFGLPLGPGFSEVLRGEVDLAEAVRPTHAAGLWLLSAGECDGDAIQLLARGATHNLLERLKQEYDFIVLDSSPVLPVADSLLLAQHVDGILLSLFHEVSRLPKVFAAYQRLSLLRVRILGVVMNGTPEEGYGYGPAYAKSESV